MSKKTYFDFLFDRADKIVNYQPFKGLYGLFFMAFLFFGLTVVSIFDCFNYEWSIPRLITIKDAKFSLSPIQEFMLCGGIMLMFLLPALWAARKKVLHAQYENIYIQKEKIRYFHYIVRDIGIAIFGTFFFATFWGWLFS